MVGCAFGISPARLLRSSLPSSLWVVHRPGQVSAGGWSVDSGEVLRPCISDPKRGARGHAVMVVL